MFRLCFVVSAVTACALSAAGQNLNQPTPQARIVFASLQKPSASVSARIAPATRGTEPGEWRAPNSWTIHGYELRTLVGMVYGFDAGRIVFNDPQLAARRYDVELVLPRCEQEEVLHAHVREALRRELNIVVSPTTAAEEVYVLSAPRIPEVRLSKARGNRTVFSTTSAEVDSPNGEEPPSQEDFKRLLSRKAAEELSFDSISMAGGTLDDFCALLEEGLDRPVLNETGLPGKYDVELRRGSLTREEFFTRVRSELGLRIAREKRQVAMLTVRSEQR